MLTITPERLRWVTFIDITGLETLEEIIQDIQSRGIRVIICGRVNKILLILSENYYVQTSRIFRT